MTNRLPSWFKQVVPDSSALELMRLFSRSGINTVCKEAKCPNSSDCFSRKKAAFMILGKTCTRDCGFCNINNSGKPDLFEDDPKIISLFVKKLGLKYVVITSVTRDDLGDGGAQAFAKTIQLIHKFNQNVKVEVLIPDFCGKISSLALVLEAGPFVLAHNIETVERLYRQLRPKANYPLSLRILSKAKRLKPEITTKSSLILGLGETKAEVIATMEDLKEHKCDVLTLGQYLAPTSHHYPVKEFISIEQFNKYRDKGLDLGFKAVLSGPKVRSSYHAEDLYQELAYV